MTEQDVEEEYAASWQPIEGTLASARGIELRGGPWGATCSAHSISTSRRGG